MVDHAIHHWSEGQGVGVSQTAKRRSGGGGLRDLKPESVSPVSVGNYDFLKKVSTPNLSN